MTSISPEMSAKLVEYDSPTNEEPKTRANLEILSEYKNSDVYNLKFNSRPYGNQFSSIYYNRLNILRPKIFQNAQKKWGKEVINGKQVVKKSKVLDIRANEPCWVVGTVYCEMKYKPNVLEEVTKGILNKEVSVKSYTNPDLDEVMLEDESGRVLLEGHILKNTILVTGVIVGILGMETKPGIFQVVDLVYPFLSAQKPSRESNTKVAIVSGLEFNGIGSVKHDLLIDYLTGQLGGNSEEISRLIIAGNSVHVEGELEITEKNRYSAKHKSNYNVESVNQLDSFLSQILQSIPVDIMPGETDPAETSLPQQSLHRAFFQQSSRYLNTTNFRTLTNPSWFQIEGLRMLGTGGENINDIYKYIIPDDIKDSRIAMLESTILWQNIIPTAPDTLWCYPFSDTDPFTLTETPHVYFVGNQPRYETKIAEYERDVKVKLIAIPSFKETGQVVILNTNTLETEIITIEV